MDHPERVRRLRQKLGLTQAELAERLGVSTPTVSRWESGHAKPPTAMWHAIVEAEEHGAYALRRAEGPALRVAERAYAWGSEPSTPAPDFSADPEKVRAVAEAERLTYGHLFNPAFAAEVSLVEPLPHQRIAVYERLLPLPRIRFLLADDPGAGKTIMSGLLIRELLSRRLVRRVLIVPPAGLVANWKREMRTLFQLPFEIVSGGDAKASNPFLGDDSNLVIVSVDTLAGERMFARLQEPSVVPYDIVFFDEAHKLSANRNADYTIDKTDRYRLAEALAGIYSGEPRWTLSWSATHVLLLTATPHMGREYPYYALWRLLDPDVFGSVEAFNQFPIDSRKRYFIRRSKEEMVRYDGTRIYPERISDTIGCPMSTDEEALYNLTTEYIRSYYNRARMLNRSAARLAMSVFQRRLTSSTYALIRSFERRVKKLDALMEDIRSGRIAEHELDARQRKLGESIPDPIDSKTADEEEGEETEEIEERALGGVVAANLIELGAERAHVDGLLSLARQVYDKGEESKFERLREVIQDPRFRHEKILIFTEHKDTLDFLVHRLEGVGFAGQVAQIHGGMPYGEEADVRRLSERQDNVEFFRLPAEKGGATYMVCTDAAAEGINLQFCWLMINYDIPWNPARLEQRMGRIHRFGQKHDPVHIVNLVSDPEKTREGRVLKTLLDKLEKIREELGSDKVFDVIGRLFDGKTLAEYMESVVASGKANDTAREIDSKVTRKRVEEAKAEESARYGGGGEVARELPKLKAELAFEELRRLMPGHVRRFVEKAAPLLDIGIDGDLGGIFSFKSIKPFALDPFLAVIESYPAEKRNRFSVTKPEDPTTTVFFHPGEPVFDRIREWVDLKFSRDALKGSVFIDPYSQTPYVFHLALATIVRRADPLLPTLGRAEVLESRLVGVRWAEDGMPVACPVEHLLLLRGGEGVPARARKYAATAGERLGAVRRFFTDAIALPLLEEQKRRLFDSAPDRESYVRLGFDYQEADLLTARTKLREKAKAGSLDAAKELEKVKRRQHALDGRRAEALEVIRREPELLEVSEIEFVAHALAVPSSDPEDKKRHDAEVEQIAMRIAWAHEEAAMAHVSDVHTPELARAAGLTDYPGFDVHSRRLDGTVRAIEVKGRARVGDVEVSENEWAKAATLRGGYWLYTVFDCATPTPRLHIVRDPFAVLLFKNRESVVVRAGDIIAAGRESAEPVNESGSARHPLLGLLAKWSAEPPLGDETALVETLEASRRDNPIRLRIPSTPEEDS